MAKSTVLHCEGTRPRRLCVAQESEVGHDAHTGHSKAGPSRGMRLLYHAYELQRAWLSGVSAWASIGAELMSNPRYPAAYLGMGPMAASALEVFAHATQTYGKPAFDIEAVTLDGRSRAVTEAIVYNKPFGDLRRFTRDGLPGDAPKVLIVAPVS